jgi:signal transduction histidine kinase
MSETPTPVGGVPDDGATRNGAPQAGKGLEPGPWFADLLASTTDGVVGVGADGRVCFLNAVAERLLGRRATDVVGLPADEALRTGHVLRRRDVKGAAGRGMGSLVILASSEGPHRDSLGLVAAGVGHQLNNLLQGVQGHAESLAGRLPKTPRAWRDSVEKIQQIVQSAAELVASMTRVARTHRGRARLVDLVELVQDAPRWLRPILPGNIEIVTDVGSPITAWVDPGQFELMLEHMARNAADAMPGGGVLRISTRLEAPDRSDPTAACHPVILVADNGSGMPQEVLDRLFEPFFSTRPESGHLGLGLSVIYELVHRHGGFVEVESSPGKGSTFKVSFSATAPPFDPIVVTPEPGPEPQLPPTPPPLGEELHGSETVLVVEDNDAVRTLITEELTELGYNILQASRGDEGLDVAKAHDGPIHLLVSDVMMPGVGGVELARALRDARPFVQIILLSGYVSLDLNERLGRDLGAIFVSKPFPLGVLARQVRDLLDGKPGTVKK